MRNRKGFTLVEVLVSIGLLALIGTVIGISLNKAFKDNNKNNYDEFAAAVAKHTDITADEFTELMKGCDVRTMEQTGEAFEDGDTYVSLKYCADMLSGFLVDNGLIDEKPSNLDDLFDSSVYDEVRSELKK